MALIQWIIGILFWGGLIAAAYADEVRTCTRWLRRTGPLWMDTIRTAGPDLETWARLTWARWSSRL